MAPMPLERFALSGSWARKWIGRSAAGRLSPPLMTPCRASGPTSPSCEGDSFLWYVGWTMVAPMTLERFALCGSWSRKWDGCGAAGRLSPPPFLRDWV